MTDEDIKSLIGLSKVHGVPCPVDKIRTLHVPQTRASMMAASWFINLAGGQNQPNSYGEVHLNERKHAHVYDRYRNDLKGNLKCEMLEASQFYALWDAVFPNVKVRVYQNVTGKCVPCTIVKDALAKKNLTPALKRELNGLLAVHHASMRASKTVYYDTRTKCIENPSGTLSIISDGMAQSHTELPYLRNELGISDPYKTKLQGVRSHGHWLNLYRFHPHLRGGANQAIHALLLELEEHICEFGALPPTVFLQLDGGSENYNRTLLAVCEHIVAMRLTKQVIVTRLPVGHTHEVSKDLLAVAVIMTRVSVPH
jgi:hypothetical protein